MLLLTHQQSFIKVLVPFYKASSNRFCTQWFHDEGVIQLLLSNIINRFEIR